jgi:hypothetical protein
LPQRSRNDADDRHRRNRRQACPSPPIQKARHVSASALAQHYIGKLEAEGVKASFPIDPSRVAYLRHLRGERQQ